MCTPGIWGGIRGSSPGRGAQPVSARNYHPLCRYQFHWSEGPRHMGTTEQRRLAWRSPTWWAFWQNAKHTKKLTIMWRSSETLNRIIKACKNKQWNYIKGIKGNMYTVLKEIKCPCSTNKELQNKDRQMHEIMNYINFEKEKYSLLGRRSLGEMKSKPVNWREMVYLKIQQSQPQEQHKEMQKREVKKRKIDW